MNTKQKLLKDLNKIYRLRLDLKDIDKNNNDSVDDDIANDYCIEIEKMLEDLINNINNFDTCYCDLLNVRQLRSIEFVKNRGSHFNIRNFKNIIDEIDIL